MKQISQKQTYDQEDFTISQLILDQYYQSFQELCQDEKKQVSIQNFISENKLPLQISGQMNSCQIISLLYILISTNLQNQFNQVLDQKTILQFPEFNNYQQSLTLSNNLQQSSNQLKFYRQKVNYTNVPQQNLKNIEDDFQKSFQRLQTQLLTSDKNNLKSFQKLSHLLDELTKNYEILDKKVENTYQQNQQQSYIIQQLCDDMKLLWSNKQKGMSDKYQKFNQDIKQQQYQFQQNNEQQKQLEQMQQQIQNLTQTVQTMQQQISQLQKENTQLKSNQTKQQNTQQKQVSQLPSVNKNIKTDNLQKTQQNTKQNQLTNIPVQQTNYQIARQKAAIKEQTVEPDNTTNNNQNNIQDKVKDKIIEDINSNQENDDSFDS